MTIPPLMLRKLDEDLMKVFHKVIEDTSILTMSGDDAEELISDRKDISDFLLLAVSAFRDNNCERTEVRRILYDDVGLSVMLALADDGHAYFELVNLKDAQPNPRRPSLFVALADGVHAATIYFGTRYQHMDYRESVNIVGT